MEVNYAFNKIQDALQAQERDFCAKNKKNVPIVSNIYIYIYI